MLALLVAVVVMAIVMVNVVVSLLVRAIAMTTAGMVADLKRVDTEEREMEALLRSLEKHVASAGC